MIGSTRVALCADIHDAANGDAGQDCCSESVGEGVGSGYSVEKNPRSAPTDVRSGEKTRHCKCAECAYGKTRECDGKRFSQHDACNFAASRTQSYANPDLSGTFGDGVGGHTEDAHECQDQRQSAERSQQSDNWAAQAKRLGIVN